jgi:hypothetical protein
MRHHRAAAVARLLFATSAAALVGLICGTAIAAPAFVSATSASTTAPSQTLTIATPAGVSAGHVLVASIAVRIGSATSIAAPPGWTTVNRTACASGPAPLTQAIFVRAVTGAEPATHAFTATAATGVVGAIAAYTGVDPVQPVLAASGAFARNARVLDAPSVTASVPGAMLLGAFVHSALGALTPPAGMTVRANVPTGGTAPTARALMVDQLLAATGPTGPRRAETQQRSACTVSQLVALRPVPDTPVNVAPPLIQGTAQNGRILTATTGTWTGSPTSYSYQWQRSADGLTWVGISGATSAPYAVTTADVGMAIRVIVVAANAGGSQSATSAPTQPVLPAPPVNLSPPQVSGTPMENQTLAATAGSWSGTPTGYVYAWQRCDLNGANCVAIAGAAGPSYTLASADVGSVLRVAVTATNASGSATVVSEPSTAVLPLPPVNAEPPTITGIPEAGQTMSASSGVWQSSGALSYAYQWQVSTDGGSTWADLAGAVSQTYALTGGDIGFTLRVSVTASNAGGSATGESAATEAIRPGAGPPVNALPPTMAGVLQPAGRLTARPGTWSGSPAFAYQWQRSTDGGSTWADLAGAVGQTYTVGASDVGAAVRVMVTAVNSSGSARAAPAGREVHPAGNLVVLVNQFWRCNATFDIDLVKVAIDDGSNTDAIVLDGCRGSIGRVEVDTNGADGIKVRNGLAVAQDLVVEGGYVRCNGHPDGAHQDGIQVMGGYRLTFRALVVWCGHPNGQIGDGVNSSVMIALAGGGTSTPTDVVFERSAMGPGTANGVFVQTSVRSGIRDSVACPDLTPTGGSIFFGSGALDGINTGNERPPASDPRCTSFEAALAWAETPPAPQAP